MNIRLSQIIVALALVLLFAACSEKPKQVEETPEVSFYGRIDFGMPESPVIIWQGSRIEFAVQNASELDLNFSRKSGQVYFDLLLEGRREIFTPQQGANRIALTKSPQPTKITLIKRSEAGAGSIAFDGLTFPGAGNQVALPREQTALKFLFYGDSITAGACNEDGDEDQWDDLRTHNALKSYAALTAEQFSADYQNISISGMGISVGYVASKFPETWNKLYPYGDSAAHNLSDFQPDYVFVNLGENDGSWSKNRGVQFPLDYDERYIEMVKSMRAAYPDAKIVLLRGGMGEGKNSPYLREAWEKVVATLKRKDDNISHYVFRHWSSLHPRVRDHQKMADELIAWLKRQDL